MINVVLVDDHPIVSDGLKCVLQSYPGITVLDSFESGLYLLDGLKTLKPDVLLLDLQLKGNLQGLDLIGIVKKSYPEIKIVVLTSNANYYNIQMVLHAGADGYVLKNTEQRLLAEALETVMLDETYLSPEVKDILLVNVKKKGKALASKEMLTPRELDILRLITKEYNSQEIGKALHLSLRTVETYRLGIMQKLDVKNMVGMTKKAIMLGILD